MRMQLRDVELGTKATDSDVKGSSVSTKDPITMEKQEAIKMNLDFSTSRSPTPGEFLAKVAFMLVLWACTLAIVKGLCRAIAVTFWSRPIPINLASIPSKLPHPNPPGSAVPFDVPLTDATDAQIQAFMHFRGVVGRYRREDREALQRVSNCAAAYKGQLYQQRTMRWIDDHFRLQLKNLKYPYVDRHW